MQGVIFAAGKSTRCFPLTETRPKPLLPVANKPIILYHLENLQDIVDEVIIVIGYKGNMIQEFLGDNFNGLPIKYVEQKKLNGTGGALQTASHLIKGNFLLITGDDLIAKEDLLELAKEKNAILVDESTHPEDFGNIELKQGNISCIIEKPKEPKTNLVNTAFYVFENSFLGCLDNLKPSIRGELELTDAINEYVKITKVKAVKVKKYWLGMSHSWSLLDANAKILEELPEKIEGNVMKGATITGKLILGKGSKVLPGSYIEGNVIVGENTQIGPNCYIRGSSSIGSNCKVGNAVEIKNTILMDGAKVGHLSYVGDSVLGFDVNFGAGTITANLRHDNSNVKTVCQGVLIDSGRRKFGTICGDHVHTGIHTSIYPGRKFAPGTSCLPGDIIKKDVE